MKWLRIYFLFQIILFSSGLASQQNSVEREFICRLINQPMYHSSRYTVQSLNTDSAPYWITISDNNNPDNVDTVTYTLLAHDDLDGDSIADYIVMRNYETLTSTDSGKLRNDNQLYLFYLLDKHGDVKKLYELVGKSPDSYAILDNATYRNGCLSVRASYNTSPDRSYYILPDTLKTKMLHFRFRNGALSEDSYWTDCDLAKMGERIIFKKEVEYVISEQEIDMYNFTSIIQETLIKGDTVVSASINGCDNLALKFDVKIKMERWQGEDISSYSEYGKSIFNLLIRTTRYKTWLTKTLNAYSKLTYEQNEPKSHYLQEGWLYLVSSFYYDDSIGGLCFSINIEHSPNLNENNNWDLLIRRK